MMLVSYCLHEYPVSNYFSFNDHMLPIDTNQRLSQFNFIFLTLEYDNVRENAKFQHSQNLIFFASKKNKILIGS